jgi:type II secretory pathway component GspD/PulD (secretin)
MVTDTVEALIQVEQIIDKFDNTLAGTTTELLKVQHVNPTELANMITTIMTSNVSSSGMLSSFNMGGMMGNMMQQGGRNTRTTNNNSRSNDRGGRNDRNSGRTSNPASMMGMGMLGASASASTIGSDKPAPTLIPDEINKVIIATATFDDMDTVKYWMAQLDTETKVVWNPGELATLGKNQVVQKIYHLQYNTPEQLAQIIEPLLTDDGYLSAEQNTGTLMIRDTVATLLQIEDIIKEFDKEEANPQVRQIFEVREGDPQEIVNIINAILSGQVTNGATGTRTSGVTNRNTRTTTNRNTNRNTGGRAGGFGGF